MHFSLFLLKYQVLNLKILFDRPPTGDMKQYETCFKYIFSRNAKNLKNIVLAGDFNINLLYFETNKKVKDFLNLIFHHNIIPLTNKPTRVTRHPANATDHIIINSVTSHNDFKSTIIKHLLVRSFSHCLCT